MALGAAPLKALEAQTIRVGTFREQAVVVAYYRSPLWNDMLKQKRAEERAARQSGDTKKVKEFETWGGSTQELAMRQLQGEAPIANIVEALQPAFAGIAEKANVDLIVAGLPYASGAVKTVDVTDFILDWLKADDATRKMVDGLVPPCPSKTRN
jgi:hypothetical protein